MSSSPPAYPDLGKSSRDLFSKGFHFGLAKLEVKSKTSTGMNLTSGGQSNGDTGKVSGFVESKQKLIAQGLTVTTKWHTDKFLNTTFDLQDKFVQGLKLSLESTLDLNKHARNGVAKAELKTNLATISLDTDLNLAGPVVNSSAVLGYQGWLGGVQMAYDTNKAKLVKNNLSLGFSTGDLVLHGNVNDGAIFGASMYKKVNPGLEVGLNLGWTASSNTTSSGVAVKYVLDKDTSLRGKVNSSSQVGLGLQQRLREGVTVTLSALVDGKNFNQGGHKVGCCLELES